MDQSVSNFPEMKVRGVMQHSQTQYMCIYIYMVPPPRKSTFFMGKRRYHIYIYIIFRCFGNLDFVLEGEEFDYKGRIEIANQRRGV